MTARRTISPSNYSPAKVISGSASPRRSGPPHGLQTRSTRGTFATFLLLLPVLLLSSCFMPETFTATLNVTKDYRYTFEYDGLIAFGPAIGEIAQHGSLPKKADDDMREGTANTFKKEEGFDHASYQGKGRWKVHFKKNGAITDTANLFGDGLPIVTLRRTAGGNVSIEGMTVDPKIAQQLRDVHFVIDGNLEVTTDMTVVSHNATETPKLLGLIGHYGWKISSEHLTSPVMKLGPSPAALAELQRQQDLARLATTESSSRRATAASRDSHGPGSTGRRGGSRERGG